MTTAEILLLDFEPEIASARRLLERIPEDNPAWKPHEKSMPIGRLALHVARLPDFATRLLTTDELDIAAEKFAPITFESTAHLLTELDRAAAEARGHLAAAADDYLKTHWKLAFGDRVLVDEERSTLYRTMFLNHLVHHRGQLCVYLRLLDIPVPGLYGPSADEPFR